MTLYEYYNTGNDGAQKAYGTTWVAQTFTVGTVGANENHKITSVKLLIRRYNLPGTLTVGIRATDGSGYPTGSDLTSGSIDGNSLPTTATWTEITVTEYTLNAGIKYAIVARAPSGSSVDYVIWSLDKSSPTYTGGSAFTSSNSGSSWTEDTTKDLMFEEYGTALSVAFMKPTKYW